MQHIVSQAGASCSHVLSPLSQCGECPFVARLLPADISTPWTRLACSTGSNLCFSGALHSHAMSPCAASHLCCRQLDGPFWQACSSLQAAPLLLAAFQDLRNADDLAFRHASAQVGSCLESSLLVCESFLHGSPTPLQQKRLLASVYLPRTVAQASSYAIHAETGPHAGRAMPCLFRAT